MDVVAAAWAADPARATFIGSQSGGEATCARCAATSHAAQPLGSAISPMFTAFDNWHAPTSGMLCPPCCWVYQDHDLRKYAHRITTAPSLEVLTPQRLVEQLRTPPTSDESVTVPLRPGRKHLLPEARWGTVRIDDSTLSWSPADVDRLAVLLKLYRRGVRRSEFGEPTPPWRLLASSGKPVIDELMTMWDDLEAWRRRPPWLALALHLLKATL